MNLDDKLAAIQGEVQAHFERAERVLSFDEFLEDVYARPGLHLRTAPQYIVEMFDHYGTRESTRIGRMATRYVVFDEGEEPLAGQERAQGELYRYFRSFAQRGKADKMLLLHGPNGSGKTTLIEALIRGLERYSRTPQGALYTFNWVFTERDHPSERIGFDPSREAESEERGSYARLDEREISSRIGCELKDSPLFLLPFAQRESVLADVMKGADLPEHRRAHFLRNDLCQKCKRIFDRLLVAYQGDWRRMMRHVQVVRFVISKRYRSGAVSIEPQGNVDAGVRAIASEGAYSIPTLLRNISLYEPVGDVIDANRGILEYSDFLKRPLETNKYLLTTCERGTVSLPNCVAYLDQVILATANEKQLSFFKRSPDFSSFKGRMELIAVPYLLRFSTEAELYRRHTQSYARDREVAPHTARVAALWAVLTRLRRPDPSNYESPLREIVAALSPLDKAKLYDGGETPDRLSEDERKVLRAAIRDLRDEFEDSEAEFENMVGAEYEGRRGVSPREMMMVLARAAESRKGKGLTPMAVFDAIEELLRDASLYDFLRLQKQGKYHDPRALLDDVRREYVDWVTQEVYRSIGLIDESEYDRVFLEYFRHVKAFDAKEHVRNPTTDALEPPDERRMSFVESRVGISEPPKEWRSNIMLRIAGWSLDHPGRSIDYHGLFPEIHRALRETDYRERERLLTLIENDILKYGTSEFDFLSAAEQKQVADALDRMRSLYGYTVDSAREVIAFALRERSAAPGTFS